MSNGCKHEANPTSSEVRYKRRHLKTNKALKTEKKIIQKPYKSLVCSVCSGKYLSSVFFAQPLARLDNKPLVLNDNQGKKYRR